MFQSPTWLWLLLPIAAVAALLGVKRPRSLPSLLLRLAATALIVVGIAGLRLGGGRPRAALLIDASLSAGHADTIVRRAGRLHSLLSRRHEVHTLLFADWAHPWQPDDPMPHLLDRSRTRLAPALALSASADCLVIAGDLRTFPRTAQPVPYLAKPVYLLPLGPENDARTEALRVPTWTSAGGSVPVLVTVRSNSDADVVVRVSLGESETMQERKLLTGVPETLHFILPASGGKAAYGKAIIETANDEVAANNAWHFAIWQRESTEILAVGARRGALAAVLNAVTDKVRLLSPEEAQAMISGGGDVPGVLVLEDVNPDQTPRLLSLLTTLVGDGGVGVLFLGGEHSFGAGGIRPSHDVSKIIPAGLVPPGGKGIKVVVVLDCSGSMARPAAGFPSKLAAVRRALLEGLSVLSERDQSAVIAFNQQAWTALEPTAYQPGTLQEAMSRLEAGGGTDISAGIMKAAPITKSSDERTVLFLVSDGDPDRGEEGKADALRAASSLKRPALRIVVIGTAENQDEKFLHSLAESLGGKAYLKASAGDLRAILIKEISNIKAEFISYKPETPRAFQGHPLVQAGDLTPVPIRNRLSVRNGASTILVCGEENAPEPFAALMDYGAGRTALIATSSYQSDWLGRGQAAGLLKSTLSWLARDKILFASVKYAEGKVVFRLEGRTTGTLPDVLKATLRPLSSSLKPMPVELLRVEQRLYQGRLGQLEPGLYSLSAEIGNQEVLGLVSLPFQEEYLQTGPDWPAIRKMESEGRLKVIKENELSGRLAKGGSGPSPWPFVLALSLFLLDLYFRRRPRPTG